MKFSLLAAIVPDEMEEKVREAAKEAGAGGVTIISGRGSSYKEKKSFFGLTYEGTQAILIYVVEKRLSLKILKAIKKIIDSDDDQGVAFCFPIEHLAGINIHEIESFEKKIIEDI